MILNQSYVPGYRELSVRYLTWVFDTLRGNYSAFYELLEHFPRGLFSIDLSYDYRSSHDADTRHWDSDRPLWRFTLRDFRTAAASFHAGDTFIVNLGERPLCIETDFEPESIRRLLVKEVACDYAKRLRQFPECTISDLLVSRYGLALDKQATIRVIADQVLSSIVIDMQSYFDNFKNQYFIVK